MAIKRTRDLSQNPQDGHLSSVAENYLLSLYVLREESAHITLSRLADHLKSLPEGERLGTSLPSVAGMLRRMAREDLVEVGPDRQVHLTRRGDYLAEDMVRRHRLAERMVVDLLGVELHRAHIEAHRLEHAISPELLSKIASRLGNPQTCPFGHPIPGSDQTPPGQNPVNLGQASLATRHIIDRVPEHDNDLLRFLVDEEILPGREIVVTDTAPYRGVLTIAGPLGHDVALGLDIASRIWVHPI
jgi:DtxR family Mn-dependent transcriptional regulator